MRHFTSYVLAAALVAFTGTAMAKDMGLATRPHAEQVKKKADKKTEEKKTEEKKPEDGAPAPAPQGGAGETAPKG